MHYFFVQILRYRSWRMAFWCCLPSRRAAAAQPSWPAPWGPPPAPPSRTRTASSVWWTPSYRTDTPASPRPSTGRPGPRRGRTTKPAPAPVIDAFSSKLTIVNKPWSSCKTLKQTALPIQYTHINKYRKTKFLERKKKKMEKETYKEIDGKVNRQRDIKSGACLSVQ